MKKLLLGILLVATAVAGHAQEMPPVPAEMSKVDYWVGEWTAKLTTYMMGQKGSADSTVTYKKVLGGRHLHGMHSYKMDGMEMTGMQMLSYDASTKKWVSYWFDSFEPTGMEMTGPLGSDKIVLVSKPTKTASMPNEFTMRATYTKKSDKSLDFKLEMKEAGDWQTLMEGTYTKK
ncbi:MAG: hypothetical protein HONBIEJF_02400 [Fimbriimonadaceae bacterium]|nr:hypothetical protein [Fimbriimonadaceae bacterium]